MSYENMTLDEIEIHIARAEKERKEINRAIKARRREGKGDIVNEILDLIVTRGYEPHEIINPLIKAVGRRSSKVVVRYVDPENPDNIYLCGPTPIWLKENMIRDGFNPNKLADRIRYRHEKLIADRQ